MKKKWLSLVSAVVMLLSVLPFTSAAEEFTSGDYTYTLSDAQATITKAASSLAGDITIPSFLDGYPVATIGDKAFYDNDGLTSVVIPDSVTKMGNFVFQDCRGLTSVTIGDGLKAIGGNAFADCTSLRTVDMGQTVGTIRSSAFDGCTSLSDIVWSPCVVTVDSYAFRNCSSLAQLSWGDRIVTVGKGAFMGCSALTSVTIPEKLTKLPKDTFAGCIGLESVYMSENLVWIDDRAFADCTAVSDVYYAGNQDDWDYVVLKEGNEAITTATFHYDCTEKTSYTVTYDAYGGEGAPQAQTKLRNEDITLSSVIPTREGYTFRGWAAKKGNSSTSFSPGDVYTRNADLSLQASWQANEYLVTFDANGGEGAPISRVKIHGLALYLSMDGPTREGYTHVGWSEDPFAKTVTYTPDTFVYLEERSVTLYAVWKKTVWIGNVVDDNSLDMMDALFFFAAMSGERPLTDAQLAVADIDGDGTVNMMDALRLFKQVSGQ